MLMFVLILKDMLKHSGGSNYSFIVHKLVSYLWVFKNGLLMIFRNNNWTSSPSPQNIPIKQYGIVSVTFGAVALLRFPWW